MEQINNELISDISFFLLDSAEAAEGLLATMLLSSDVQQYQERNEVTWSRGYANAPYKTIRYQKRKDSSRNNTADAKYVCNRCGKTYKAPTSLSRHRRLECGVIPCEVCPICDRRFKHRFVLNSHIVGCQRRLRHIMQKRSDSPYLADEQSKPITDKGYSAIDKLEFIMNNPTTSSSSSSFTTIHRGQTTLPEDQHFMCGECGKGYKWMANLMRHQRYECEKSPKYRCRICMKNFYRRYVLRNHIKTKHNTL
ncbi:zinc finger protein 343-like [Vespula maculifrons]|uniref:Zinc finger protein 343-like n=1 Tax=Vespula maculifrons TaxID=7453 RepID=A0ABD2C0W9_VESMC